MSNSLSQKDAEYTLHYWPTIPGRGEFIRLALIAANKPWKESNDPSSLMSLVSREGHFAVPVLEVKLPNENGRSYTISQTPAILHYLGMIHGLDGIDTESSIPPELQRAKLNQITLTALDLSNEVHDSHHPIGAGLYYKEQKSEALRRAKDVRENRIPKFFSHFDDLMASHGGTLVQTGTVTTADLTLWQVMDGIHFAFPNLVKKLKGGGKFDHLFAFYSDLPKRLPHVKEYLDSDKRLPFGDGLFRHYPELDEKD
ncbi:unnamed protein product [Sympodiomycopsis kandeliae]